MHAVPLKPNLLPHCNPRWAVVTNKLQAILVPHVKDRPFKPSTPSRRAKKKTPLEQENLASRAYSRPPPSRAKLLLIPQKKQRHTRHYNPTFPNIPGGPPEKCPNKTTKNELLPKRTDVNGSLSIYHILRSKTHAFATCSQQHPVPVSRPRLKPHPSGQRHKRLIFLIAPGASAPPPTPPPPPLAPHNFPKPKHT